jgi:hypothetical protein
MLLTFLMTGLAAAQSSWTPGESTTPAPPNVPTAAPIHRWKESKPTIVGGLELFVLGVAVGIGTNTHARANNEDVAKSEAVALQALNVAGWTVAGCGLVVSTIGTIHGTGLLVREASLEVAVSPNSIAVSGKF